MCSVHVEHIGLQCSNKDEAILFFQEVCGFSLMKSFELNNELSKKIFSIDKSIDVLVFKKKGVYFEIFINQSGCDKNYSHVCLSVGNLDKFFETCKLHGLKPFSVMKNEKELFFVRDFSENLYEVKK